MDKKHEWRELEKELYFPKDIPTIIQVPKQKFFTINGKGDPTEEDFIKRIKILFSVARAVKTMPENGFTPDGYFEYDLYPLEGVWDLTKEGKMSAILNKDKLIYTIMIRQPDFVNISVAKKAIEIVRKQNPHPLLDEIKFEEFEDGLCVQMLHHGSYDDEQESFIKMRKFVDSKDLLRRNMSHREIYLNNLTKVKKEELKTVLRWTVR